nr:hypothetical protein [Hypnea sp.]
MLKIYLVSLILILFGICSIISNEVYKISNNYILLYHEKTNEYKNILKIAQAYINKKKWVSCIVLLEQSTKKGETFLIDYYNALGYCYCYIKIYTLAEFYYNQTINQDAENIIALCNLGNLYISNKRYKDAYIIYKKVSKLDQYNSIAKKQIKALAKYL